MNQTATLKPFPFPPKPCAELKPIHPVGWRKYRDLFKEAYNEWNADNGFRLGAAISYYTVFSLGPVLMITIYIAGLLFGQEAARGHLALQMSQLLGVEGAKAVEALLLNAKTESKGGWAAIVGTAALILGALGVFAELKSALNIVFRAEAKAPTGIKGFLRDRLLSFAMVLCVGFLLLVSLVVSAVLAAATKYFQGYLPLPEWILHISTVLVSLLIITALFAMIFKVLPDIHLEWRDVILGAGLTSLLFTIGKFLLGLYLGRSSFASSYGASGSVIVVMVWAYYSSAILFFGAEFAKVYAWGVGSLQRPTA